MDLTDEQISKLTPEQVTEFENDEEALAKYLADQEKGEPETNESEQEDDDGAAHGADEVTEEEPEEEEPIVRTKNGKREIPYSEHKALRVKVATLEEQLEQFRESQKEAESLKAKLAELQALQKQMDGAKTTSKRSEIQERFDKRVATLKEDFPDVGDSLDAVKELVNDVVSDLENMKAETKKRAQEAEAMQQAIKAKEDAEAEKQKRIIDEQVQEAKGNNPDLVHWESLDGDEWREAMFQDAILIQNPKWAKRPMEERFVEVVKRVRAIMPEASEPPNTASAKTKESVKAKLEKAPTRKPTTLSDIQGGGDPLSEKERIENLSPGELAQKLMKMPASAAAAMRADLD